MYGQHQIQAQSQGQFGGMYGQHQSQTQSQGQFGGYQAQHQSQGQWFKRSKNDKSEEGEKKESVVVNKIVTAQKQKEENLKILGGLNFYLNFI